MTEFRLPPAQDLERLIRQEHHGAELLRLRMGMAGCGCAECQEFYSTIELVKYGSRVCYGDSVLIEAGKAGADLIGNLPDYWTPKGSYVHYGKKYSISKNLATLCLGAAAETPPDGTQATPASQEAVTKIVDKGIIPAIDIQNGEEGFLLQKRGRGRPRKQDDESVSRMTKWRREQEPQGVLL